jgi:hypothetical protein
MNMDFRLTKKEDAERDNLIAELNLRQTRLEKALESYNANMEQEQAIVQEALDNYNAALEEAREFTSDIASQADSDIADRSDKWQESEKGQAAAEWKDAWAGVALDEIEISFPDPIEVEFDISELEEAPSDSD